MIVIKVGVLFIAGFDPPATVLKVLPGMGIVPAQKGAAHAAVDDVVPRRVGQRDEGGAGSGHGWAATGAERSYSAAGSISILPGHTTVP